jgi:HTH-type transcriptional regulator / antitoxin HigA
VEEMNAQAVFNERAYRKILGNSLPRPIHNEAELHRLTEQLMDLDELEEAGKATLEQRELAELLTVLIEQYENTHYPIEIKSAPHERLAALLNERGLGQSDLAAILNSRSLASEILKGKREISKAQVKKLALEFRVPAELFL